MRITVRGLGVLMVTCLLVAGCGGGGGGSAVEDVDSSDDSTADSVSTSTDDDDDLEDALVVDGAVNVAALDAMATEFASLDADQQFARVSELSGQLERDLYGLSGLEQAVGGSSGVDRSIQASAAWMSELGPAITSGIESADFQLVGYGPAILRGDGVPSIGEGIFGGMMLTTLAGDAAVSATNDGQAGSGSPAEGVVIQADSTQVQMVTEHTSTDSKGVTTTLKTRNVVTPCPSADGSFTASATIDTSSTINNGTTGKRATLDVTINGTVDDNAALVGYDMTTRSQYADFVASKGGFFDVTITIPQNGDATATFNRTGGTVTQEIYDNALALNRLMLVTASGKLAETAQKGWESGRCVELKPTVSAGPKGLKPSATVTISAAPRSKIDDAHGPVGGTVTALLSAGEAAVTPSSTPVPADAEFTYDAPNEPGKAGTVTLEARSKRGVGKAQIDFDTAASPTVHLSGPVAFSLMGMDGTAIIDATLQPDPQGVYTGTADFQITGALNAMQTSCTTGTWTESIDLTATLATEGDEPVLVISTTGDAPRGTPVDITCSTAGISMPAKTSLISSSFFGNVRIRPVAGDQAFVDSAMPGITGTVTVTVS